MTAEEEALLRELEGRVAQLALDYKDLKGRLADMGRTLREKENTIGTLRARISQLQADYADLKTARIIDISDGELKDTKARLSKLVREVDKCIALLNV